MSARRPLTLGQMLQHPEIRAARRARGVANPPARGQGLDEIDHTAMQAWCQSLDPNRPDLGVWILAPEFEEPLAALIVELAGGK